MNTLSRIKELLNQRGWSVYRLAKESDLLQSTLSNMFIRNNDPSISTLESICKGFGITMLQFFAVDDAPVILTNEQLSLLGSWSKLNAEQKQAFTTILQSIDNVQQTIVED